MDFKNAKIPELLPLKHSVGQDNKEIENQLRNLFLALFNYHDSGITFDSTSITFDRADITFDTVANTEKSLAEQAFDANVLGMAQLGSLELVRRSINADGLVLLRGDREETATRFTYKAWKSRNNQGRGFHFLRTYLQMLFPNASGVEQLAQPKNAPYPSGLIPWISANELDYYLTSRILVLLDYDKVTWEDIDRFAPILRDVVAARFVVHFGKLVTSRPKVFVGCVVTSAVTVTVYPQSN